MNESLKSILIFQGTLREVPEIQKITKILDKLESNDETTRSKISQLSERVSRLEETKFEENKLSSSNNHKIRRSPQSQQGSHSTVPPLAIYGLVHLTMSQSIMYTSKRVPSRIIFQKAVKTLRRSVTISTVFTTFKPVAR